MDREALLTAVNWLVAKEDIAREISALDRVRALQSELPVLLNGEMAVLNPLLNLYRESPQAYSNVIKLINAKRRMAGLPTPEPERTYVEYMRDFMQQKRERERRAVELENMQRSERDRLIGRARINFMQMKANEWKERRDRALEAERARVGGRLSRERMREVLDVFWAGIDTELDELEAHIRHKRQ